MIKEIKAPNQIPIKINGTLNIFLAGTIDNGQSKDWQKTVVDYFEGNSRKDVLVLNPRREKWNVDLKQSFDSPEFFQQVSWEMDAMEKSNLIILNLLPDSKSPISLLELGLFANGRKLVVCCPDEFYRSGNVQVVCNRYNIPLFKSLPELLENVQLNIL